MLGAVFFASGVSTALATIVLLMVWRRGNHETIAQLETADNYAMLIELGMLALFFVFLVFANTFSDLIGSTYGLAILGGTIGLGMLVPLLLHWQPRLLGSASPVLASVLVLAGGFVLRWALVYAGQEVNVAGR
jgi:formate-dependent nitrite reductase membrane component NrfD